MSAKKSRQTLKARYSSDSVSNKTNAVRIFSKPIIPILVVSVMIVCIFIIILFSKDGNNTDDNKTYNLVVTPNNVDELIADATSKVAEGSYDVCMNSTWKFKDVESASYNAYVENVVSNNYTVYFTLTLNETAAELYKSPYIPVGSSLKNIKLEDESLSKGTYPCTVTYHLVDDNYSEISTLNISVDLVIEAE